MNASTTTCSRPWWQSGLVVRSAVLLAAFAILYARKPDAFTRPQFWAEDGMFFYDAWAFGGEALWRPYAGYLHTIPRLMAWLVDQIDPASAPGLYVAFATLVSLWVVGLTLSDRFPIRPRIACALAIPLTPDGFEVLLNVANLQWFLCAASLALLIYADAKTVLQRVHDVTALALIGLTGPFSVLFAPLFFVRAFMRRTLWSGLLAAVVSIAAAVQVKFLLAFPGAAAASETVQAASALPAIGFRTGGTLLLGPWAPMSMPIGYALAALTLVMLGYFGMRRGAVRTERLWLAVAVLLIYAATLYRCKTVLPQLWHFGFGSRYFYPTQIVLLWLVISGIFDPGAARRTAMAAVLVCSLALNIQRLREPSLDDKHWGSYAEQLRAGGPVKIPINPDGWSLDLPRRRALVGPP